MDLNTKLTVPAQVMSRLVDDETVILDLASGMYFGLDGVGKRIWESVSAGSSLAEVIDVIAAEYDVDQAQAQTDVIDFTSDLIEKGLLSL